jgi:hypothetical protein
LLSYAKNDQGDMTRAKRVMVSTLRYRKALENTLRILHRYREARDWQAVSGFSDDL